MSVIKIEPQKIVKKIKPMHGGGQPPLGGKVYLIDQDHFLTLTDRNSASFTLKKDETVYIEY